MKKIFKSLNSSYYLEDIILITRINGENKSTNNFDVSKIKYLEIVNEKNISQYFKNVSDKDNQRNDEVTNTVQSEIDTTSTLQIYSFEVDDTSIYCVIKILNLDLLETDNNSTIKYRFLDYILNGFFKENCNKLKKSNDEVPLGYNRRTL